jgi:hypothetical protein
VLSPATSVGGGADADRYPLVVAEVNRGHGAFAGLVRPGEKDDGISSALAELTQPPVSTLRRCPALVAAVASSILMMDEGKVIEFFSGPSRERT